MQSLCHQFACGITKIDYPHDKTILDKAPSHTPMGKSDNGEDLPDSQPASRQPAPSQQPTPRQGGWSRSYYSNR